MGENRIENIVHRKGLAEKAEDKGKRGYLFIDDLKKPKRSRRV